MKNKVLINVYVPALDEKYELFISVNESINKNLELITKIVEEFSDSDFSSSSKHDLIDPNTCLLYNKEMITRNTNIKNKKLVILI